MDDDNEKPFRKLLRGAPPALPLTSHACVCTNRERIVVGVLLLLLLLVVKVLVVVAGVLAAF